MLIDEEQLLTLAREEVHRFRQKYIRCEHLLLALLRLDTSLEIDYDQLAKRIAQLPYPTCGAEETLELANGAQRALTAIQESDSEMILQSLLQHSPLLRRIIENINAASQ
jgi:hypothetical protein